MVSVHNIAEQLSCQTVNDCSRNVPVLLQTDVGPGKHFIRCYRACTGPQAGSRSQPAEKTALLQHATAAAVEAMRHSQEGSHPAKDGADDLNSLQHLNNHVDMDAGLAALHDALQQKHTNMDISRLDASYRRLLQIYRAGALGRYTLDALQ